MTNQFTAGWTDEEVEILRVMTNKGVENSIIASRLNRTEKAIAIKKSRLGIKLAAPNYESFNNRDWLHQKYVIEEYSTTDIARMAGVHYATVAKWLKRNGVEARGFYEKTIRHKKKIGEKSKRNQMENHPQWNGGKTYTNEGYVYMRIKHHPYANANSSVLEHRLVMEKFLGRYLKPEEVIHHLNEIKDDNRIENLFLFATARDHNHFHEKRKRIPGFPMLYKYDYLHKEIS